MLKKTALEDLKLNSLSVISKKIEMMSFEIENLKNVLDKTQITSYKEELRGFKNKYDEALSIL